MNARPARRSWGRTLASAAAILVLLAALVAWLNLRGEAPLDAAAEASATPTLVERGAYIASAGNCIGCHTVPEGAPFAGGRGIETPFGTVYAPNITPDPKTGIGHWSAGEFWRALHHGRSKDGRLLYPAFPYPSYTRVTREDADALYAFLRTVKPVEQASRPHALRFPYSTQAALAVWRAMFFRPADFEPEPQRSAAWNRGKYLVQGLGHCAACHSGRNFLGATRLNAEFAGGLMPDQSWYAPALSDPLEAGVQQWPRAEVVRLLKTGVSAHATVSGPMAEVVYASTQYLSDGDLDSMAQFLSTIAVRSEGKAEAKRAAADVRQRGQKLYDAQCAACHGDRGQGVPGIYPALAGNRAVTLDNPANLVQMIRAGGFSPSTAGNPRPFGMPPFSQLLSNDEIAAVSTFIRQSWGNQAGEVTPLDVIRVK
jgi:mono/diheme cytochrome c family protein